MKKLLSRKLGTAGTVLYWLVSAVLFVMPLVVLNSPWWVPILLLLLIFWIPFFLEPTEFLVYAAALVKTLVEPFDWIYIVFYISLALYFVFSIIPAILAGVTALYRKTKHYNEGEDSPMKKLFTKPYMYSLIAAVVAVCIGLGVGFWLPPNVSDVTAAYESGIAEGQADAAEGYSHQLEEERSVAEASLRDALDSQEKEFSETLQSAQRLVSSQAYQEGKSDGAKTVFDALQLENPYTGKVIETVDDYNEYVSQYLAESSQVEESSMLEAPVYEEPEPIENEVIVYWVPNGKSYHASEYCRTLNRSKTIISGTIDEAIASGHGDPCDVCY